MFVQIIAKAGFDNLKQVAFAKGRTADKAEAGLTVFKGGTRALVPQVILLADANIVKVRAPDQPFKRTQDELEESVLVIHQVVEGGKRIDPGGRQHLEKGIMIAVVGVVVARTAVITNSEPGIPR